VEVRIPARIEVAGLIRAVEAAGGFAAVLSKGEPEAGTILVIITEGGVDSRAYERMPQADGTRQWHCARRQDPEAPEGFAQYVERRGRQDADLWIVELDIANGERFIQLNDGAR
jgi:hypothetical protein